MHNIGEVWASALFEVRARFITRLGFATGNQRILQFVTDGMKLDPINPTLLQGRDSILAAADAGGGTAADTARHLGRLCRARHGRQRPGAQRRQLARWWRPSTCRASPPPARRSLSESIPNGRLDPFERVTVSLCMTNAGVTTSASVTGTLLAAGGVQSPSGPQSYGAIAPGATRVSHATRSRSPPRAAPR